MLKVSPSVSQVQKGHHRHKLFHSKGYIPNNGPGHSILPHLSSKRGGPRLNWIQVREALSSGEIEIQA
uniref:Uncharacterized protein n=1 Tax=Anguilla anguilla TaxID=7936 RepID=A0A0E9PEY9_ANGAN